MAVATWKDLQITVHEITRKQQLEMWRDLLALPEDLPMIELDAAIDEQLVLRSVRGIAHVNGKGAEPITEYAGDGFTLALPLTREQIAELPASLFNAIAKAAAAENAYMVNQLYQKKDTP